MRDLTEKEHEVLDLLGHAVIKFAELVPVHPSDIGEFQTFVHGCQNIVLARPVFESMDVNFSGLRVKNA